MGGDRNGGCSLWKTKGPLKGLSGRGSCEKDRKPLEAPCHLGSYSS